jgi:nitrite reductase/ring-hydroxylating ferredoxin subunit
MAFVPVVAAGEIPLGHGRMVEKDGVVVAVFNAGVGRFYACGAICPHEDGPLAEGWVEGDVVVCPWHGFDFDLATGRCRVAEDLAVPVYRTRLINGVVEVDLP